MYQKLGWTALSIYGLSLVGAALAPPAPSTTSITPLPPSPTATESGLTPHSTSPADPRPIPQPIVAFALNLHHTDQLHLYLQALDEIAQLGANAVEIITPVFQTDGAAQTIRLETGPGRGPQTRQLVALLNHARQRGLTTILMPQVLFTSPRGNEWRGKIQPEHWQPWWDSYRHIIDHFLDIADQAHVDIFCIGSELLSTEKQLDHWLPLISHARTRFKGPITYSTNWDHYSATTLWAHLDLIGINGYWNIATLADDPQNPDPLALATHWRQIRDKLLQFAQAQNRPLLLTEIGYPCLPWGLKDPWNYVNPKNLPAQPHVQYLGYEAFLSAWSDLLVPHVPIIPPNSTAPRGNPSANTNQPLFAGVCFYLWDPYHSGGPQDTGYGIKGKPAYDLLSHQLGNHHSSTHR